MPLPSASSSLKSLSAAAAASSFVHESQNLFLGGGLGAWGIIHSKVWPGAIPSGIVTCHSFPVLGSSTVTVCPAPKPGGHFTDNVGGGTDSGDPGDLGLSSCGCTRCDEPRRRHVHVRAVLGLASGNTLLFSGKRHSHSERECSPRSRDVAMKSDDVPVCCNHSMVLKKGMLDVGVSATNRVPSNARNRAARPRSTSQSQEEW